jgi:hypothetical protein
MRHLPHNGAIIAESPEAYVRQTGRIDMKLTSGANHVKISATPVVSYADVTQWSPARIS